jgi:hypothetical protein
VDSTQAFRDEASIPDAACRAAEQNASEWQAAAEALTIAAEDRGPLLHARIGV